MNVVFRWFPVYLIVMTFVVTLGVILLSILGIVKPELFSGTPVTTVPVLPTPKVVANAVIPTQSTIVPTVFVTTTPSPTPIPPKAQCLRVKLYTVNNGKWSVLDDVSGLQRGQTITLAVLGGAQEGIIDKARFRVNGKPDSWQETINVNPFGEYYYQYQIPKGIDALDVEAQVHHITYGWY